MSSRERILGKLRAGRKPFAGLSPLDTYRHIVPIGDDAPVALQERFIAEAEKLGCRVFKANDHAAAIQEIVGLLTGDTSILCWDFAHIPLVGLEKALMDAGCKIAAPDDAGVRVSITGADAALAATGSLVIASGAGKPRQASLLPTVHIAVIASDQLVPDFETWADQQRQTGLEHFRQASNVVVISGASRTADIAMELIMGMHGPRELHIILI